MARVEDVKASRLSFLTAPGARCRLEVLVAVTLAEKSMEVTSISLHYACIVLLCFTFYFAYKITHDHSLSTVPVFPTMVGNKME